MIVFEFFKGIAKKKSGCKKWGKNKRRARAPAPLSKPASALIDPGDLYRLNGKPLLWRSFFKNDISQWLTLAQAVKTSNRPSTKRERAKRHESYEKWDIDEYVRLKTLGASVGWGAIENIWHMVRQTRKNARHKTREVQE